VSPALLSISGLVAGYRPGLPILHGVSIHVAPSEVVTIIGPNGAGKSTLLKAVAGLIPVAAGQIAHHGRDITGIEAHALTRAGIACVPQSRNVFAKLSIRQNVAVAAHTLTTDRRQRIDGALALFPLLAERQRERAGNLSGGQRQMLAIAMAMVTQPSLVMMDEPTAGLSPKIAGEVLARIGDLAGAGTAILLVEQNAKAALRVSDRAYVLAEGQNRIDGPADALLADPAVGRIYLGMAG